MARSASGWMSGYDAATVHMAVQKVSASPGYRQARGKLISEKADKRGPMLGNKSHEFGISVQEVRYEEGSGISAPFAREASTSPRPRTKSVPWSISRAGSSRAYP